MAKKDKGDFMSRAGKITKEGYRKTANVTRKGAGQIARNYKRYIGPSAKLARGIGKLGLGAGKLALRFPGTGLAAAGLGLGAKALGKKWGRGYHYSAVRQFDKKGRKRI